MSKTVYVVTSTDLGWDCVVGVYPTYELAEAACKPEPDEAQWFKDKGYLDADGMFDTHIIHTKGMEE